MPKYDQASSTKQVQRAWVRPSSMLRHQEAAPSCQDGSHLALQAMVRNLGFTPRAKGRHWMGFQQGTDDLIYILKRSLWLAEWKTD